MKKETIKFSKTVENLYCNYEKLRIFAKLAQTVPNTRDAINSTKKQLRKYLPEFLDGKIMPGDCRGKLANEILLNAAKQKARLKANEPLGEDFPTRFLIVSHELSRTGAPKAALMLAQTLKRSTGANVSVLALKNGPIREEFEASAIPVLLIEEMPFRREEFIEFIHDFNMVFILSAAWDFLRLIEHVKIPVIWWVHDMFTKENGLTFIDNFLEHVDLLLAGSPLVMKIFTGPLKPQKMELLLYGLPYITPTGNTAKSDVVTFALLGSVCERKGTDLFIAAIAKLPEPIRKQARFIVVGENDDDTIYKQLMRASDQFSEIEIHDNMPFDKLLEAYNEFDVIVSASRADPMPIVLTYAFMFSKLCLCSDAIGTAVLLKDGENGLLFENENVADLAKKMAFTIENRSTCNRMAQQGHEIYREHFSMDGFEKSITEIINPTHWQLKKS